MRIRVLIVDDHKLLAESLTGLLGAQSDILVVDTAPTPERAVSAIDLWRPDVVIIDVELIRPDGIGVIRALREKDQRVRIVVLTGKDDWSTALDAVRAGASAFVPKGAPISDLLEAVRGVTAGHSHIPPALLTNILRALQDTATRQTELEGLLGQLSAREGDVLKLMAAGLDRAAIAERLYLSINTVRTHTKNILSKLDVHSSLEAVSLALRAGLRPDESRGDTKGSRRAS